jgi:hypothetical protein
VNIHNAALKHGIAPDDIRQAASWPLWIEDLDRQNAVARREILAAYVAAIDQLRELVEVCSAAEGDAQDLQGRARGRDVCGSQSGVLVPEVSTMTR